MRLGCHKVNFGNDYFVPITIELVSGLILQAKNCPVFTALLFNPKQEENLLSTGYVLSESLRPKA